MLPPNTPTATTPAVPRPRARHRADAVVDAVRREAAATVRDLSRPTHLAPVDPLGAVRGIGLAVLASAPFWATLGLLVAVAR